METTKKIFNYALIFVTIVAVLFIAVYVYYHFTTNDVYTNSTSTYATSVTNPTTNEKLSPLSASYYENYNNTGKEVVEFQIRAYSDQSKQALYLRGYQLIIDKEEGNTLWYYDTYNDMSWPSGHKYDETNDAGQLEQFYYIECDDELVAIRLDGSYEVTKEKVNGWKVVGAIFTGGIFGGIFGSVYDNVTETYYYTMEDLLLKIAEILKGCSYGTGDYTLPLIDVGAFLHMYEVSEDGTVSDTPIGDGGLINSYFTLDAHYDRRGMSYAGQSMFDSVAGDSNYNVTGIDFDVDYWKATINYNLDQSDFESRYSTVDFGYYYALSQETISELKSFSDLEINIVFDISQFDNVNVLGFDYYALNGIKVNSLTITSDVESDFTLLVGALQDTGLTQIFVKNVDVNNLSGTEVEYEMV